MLILSLNEFNLKNTDEEIIQGTPIDPKLTFNKHIKNSCKMTGQIVLTLEYISIH